MRVVGSFKKGTILAGHKTADIVLIIKHLPTLEDITNIQVRRFTLKTAPYIHPTLNISSKSL